jgi:hypothetical protein
MGLGLIAGFFLMKLWSPRAAAAEVGTGWWASFPTLLALLVASLFFADAAHLRRQKELVRALISFDLATGKVRWVCEGLHGRQRPLTRMNTPATSTPATDGERIVVGFDSAGMMCASREGQLLWVNRDVATAPKYGGVTSPVLRDGMVVLVSDVEESTAGGARLGSWIAALDVATGQMRWRQARQGHKAFASYATPVIVAGAGSDIVWVRGWHDVQGYDLKSGKVVCRHPLELKAHHLVASPVSDGQRLLLVGASGHECLDLAKLLAGERPVLWSRKARGEISATPVIADDRAYLVYEDGVAACLDMKTGELVWEHRLGGRFFSSVLASGGQIYFCNEAGKTFSVARDQKFRLLGEGDLGERIYASLAPAGKRVLVRTARHLYCLGE